MSNHARLSPSGAQKWMSCPASLAAERGLAEKRSQHAAEGTAAHSIAENVLRATNPRWCAKRPTFQKLKASDYVGESVEGWQITEDMAEPIQTYIDTVMAAAHGNTLHIEQRVDFSHVVGVAQSFGTADAIIINGNELQIHDLKFGRGVKVDAENNYQLMIYALGALPVFDLGNEITTVRLFIHQPRLNHVSEWALTVQELKAFGRKVKKAAKLAIELYTNSEKGSYPPVNMYSPGAKACRWCKAAATCAAYANFVYEQVASEFVDLTAAEFDAKDPGQLTDEQLFQAYSNIDFIKSWCAKVLEECYERAKAGQSLPGVKLVKGRPGNRAWKNIEAAEDILLRLAANEDIYQRSIISPKQAERVFKKNPESWALIQPYITRPEGQLILVPHSDPREEIRPGDEFSDLTKGE